MELIRGIHNLKSRHYGCVLTIGNFDGFHRGHQALIAKLQAERHRRGLPLIVVIFEPQPQEYFAGLSAPTRLTRLRDKIKFFKTAGVDTIVCINFNKKFAAISARNFIIKLLVQKLGVQFLGIGDDFRFGACRQGNVTLLKQVGKEMGFEVMSIVTYAEDGRRISSTAIRKALAQDRIAEAEKLLGHSYCLSGRVVHGNELGRTIGFPTANVSLKKQQVPIHGVYLVEVNGLSKLPLPGIMNIGNQPTVAGLFQKLEVHLLDVEKNLYGSHMEVVIREKIRNERLFISLYELKQQIANDVLIARNYFKKKHI